MTNDLELRMRPGNCSEMGFLGELERLDEVIEQDSATLLALGITHEEVASALEKIVTAIEDLSDELLSDDEDSEDFDRGYVDWFDPYDPASIPDFAQEGLPDTETGYLLGRHHIFMLQYRGTQECPWECELGSAISSMNFLVMDRSTTEYFTFPGLAIHLIRHHHFFEGHGTPFRTDPEKAVRVLGLR